MTEQDIIKILIRHTDFRETPFVMANAFIYNWECDYWTLDAKGNTREYEIKTSRSDFLIDAKKPKHGKKGANYFYYVCPEGLISKDEIPKGYGLIWIEKSWTVLAKRPRRLHDNNFDKWKELAIKLNYRHLALWRKKYTDNEITREEYWEGHLLDLSEESEENLTNDIQTI